MWKWLCILAMLIIVGCSQPNHGGSSTHTSPLGGQTTIVQSDNPKTPSLLNLSSRMTERITIPPSAGITLPLNGIMGYSNGIPSQLTTNMPMVVSFSEPIIIERIIEDKANNQLGSSWWSETADKIKASISAMRPVMWAGIILMLAGIATFHPYIKLITQMSTTQSGMIVLGGLVLIFGPMMFATHATLIICLVAAGIALYLFSYRYGSASTKAKVYKDWIDLNNDGIDDRLQTNGKP